MILLAAGLCGGCNLDLRKSTPVGDGGVAPAGGGVGAACTADSTCRTGLTCSAAKTCQAAGNRPPGGACTLTAECTTGHHCSIEAVCAPNGTSPAGGKCTLEKDCAAGLLCNFTGLAGTCAPVGTGDLGVACTKATDCMGGLVCSLGKCESFENIEPWSGAVCPEPTAAARVLFKVPRATDRGDDFYALPFPNDIRKVGGKISLKGHPSPGARYLPIDPVQSYLSLAEQDLTAFGTNTGVYFRFSRAPKADTVNTTTVNLVNLTPGSAEYGKPIEILTSVRTEKSFYVCSPSLVVRPKYGSPLRAGETYAVVLRRGITDDAGMAFDRDEDFPAMLVPGTPANPELATAWTAYAPLRAWLTEQKVDPTQLVAAAVFTTQTLEDPIMGLRRAVREGAAPVIKGFMKCGTPGAKSPCDDGKTGAEHVRGCIDPAPTAYDEYQGTIAIPVFQAGKKPYESAADGGGIEFDMTGKAMAVASEDVCFTLTLPKGTAPAAGWPVVVYAHGTGGNYRSVINQSLSADFAAGMLSDGAVPMATFGYDGALHANRRGGSERSPDDLVYNFVNARGARDTSLQAGADLFVIARALEAFGNGVTLDPAKLTMYGHSQGGNAAALAVPYEPGFGAVVLSGTGGTLSLSLLAKKKPVDVAAGIPLLLGDPKVDADHPVLNVLQMYFERSDGVNFGRRMFREPPAGVRPHNALHVFGTDDTYSPVRTQQTYAQAAGFPLLMPVVDDHLPTKVAAPVKGNIMAATGAVTAAQAQFKASGSDGHFVSTDNPEARRIILQTLATYVRDGVSTVGGP